MLFINFETRKRLRVRQTHHVIDGKVLKVTVEQAYANCPKFIQRRKLESVDP